jgi:hypothetical protein
MTTEQVILICRFFKNLIIVFKTLVDFENHRNP